MRYLSILFALLIMGCNQLSTHRSELKLNASPIVGDVGMRSAKVWCQLASGNKLAKPYVFLLDSADQCLVAKPMVSAKLGDCFQLQLTDLSPGTRYLVFHWRRTWDTYKRDAHHPNPTPLAISYRSARIEFLAWKLRVHQRTRIRPTGGTVWWRVWDI